MDWIKALSAVDIFSKRLFLLGEVCQEDFPICLLALFSLTRDCMLLNYAIANIQQQLEDLENDLVVQLCGGGLVGRIILVLIVSMLAENLVVSQLDLCKSNTVYDVADQLNTLFSSLTMEMEF